MNSPVDENGRSDNQGESKALSALQEELDELRSKLNTERFVSITLFVAIFDAVAFAFYDSWAAPICITALQFAALFVLANRLGVSEVVSLFFEVIRSWGHRERDPS